AGVVDDQHLVQRDRVAAEGERARRFAAVEPDARLEPLAFAVDQRHQRDRRVEGGRSEPGEAVEAVFLRRVEHAEGVHGLDAFLFREFLLTEHGASWPRAAKKSVIWMRP